MKIKEKIRDIFQKFRSFITWHRFPERPEILSIFEFLVYIIVFVGCFLIYKKWNNIPERFLYVQVEDLTLSKEHHADVSLRFNYSQVFRQSVGEFSNESNVYLTPHFYNPNQLNIKVDYLKSNQLYPLVQRDDMINIRECFESVMNSHDYRINNNLLFYAAVGTLNSHGIVQNKFTKFNDFTFPVYTLVDTCRVKVDDRTYNCIEQISTTEILETLPSIAVKSKGIQLGYPKWWWGNDISQSYFNICLFSETMSCNTIDLTIDFVGATNFSAMDPSPDYIGMNYVRFISPEKIYHIMAYGLQFHAAFPEMQNKQMIRVFALTGILGFILTIFFSFLVNTISYWVNKRKSKD